MIGWQNPAALWGLLLLAGPVVVHLLRRHRAERVLFPSVRFVETSQTAAVRFRPPADLVLLLVRVAILAFAVAAAAGPIVLTASRISRWTGNTARAVVVDASESMRGAEIVTAAADASRSELQSAAYGQRFDSRDLADGIQRAASWLKTTPPSRKEIVVVSDFQRGAVDPRAAKEAVSAIDAAIGLRFMAVGRAADRAVFDGTPLLGSPAVAARSLTLDVTTTATAAEFAQNSRQQTGLRLIAPPDHEVTAARLLNAIARAGTPAGDSSEPVAIRFAGGAQDFGSVEPIRSGWMLNVVSGVGRSATLRSLLRDAATAGVVSDDLPWVVALRRDDGKPIVSAARVRNELVIDVGASADTLFAAAVVRTALTARHGIARYAEREIDRIEPGVLASLERPPGPIGNDAWRYADGTDARWCWLGALVFLALEPWLRSARARAAREDVRATA
ncbi:MAG TPA: BatA domain-containing protein [Vicinamibacterales bacterium]|nr:BatA domain-containing protein [Vicinamibacterales bacterium]